MTSGESKTLSAWKLELKKLGKKHWLRFYEELLGQRVSNIPRFYKTLNLYGEPVMFEAIVAASLADLTGDPFFYMAKIAKNKWDEEQTALDTSEEYEAKIKRSIEESYKHNVALQEKLGRKNA